jgi:hypothetical protein
VYLYLAYIGQRAVVLRLGYVLVPFALLMRYSSSLLEFVWGRYGRVFGLVFCSALFRFSISAKFGQKL